MVKDLGFRVESGLYPISEHYINRKKIRIHE